MCILTVNPLPKPALVQFTELLVNNWHITVIIISLIFLSLIVFLFIFIKSNAHIKFKDFEFGGLRKNKHPTNFNQTILHIKDDVKELMDKLQAVHHELTNLLEYGTIREQKNYAQNRAEDLFNRFKEGLLWNLYQKYQNVNKKELNLHLSEIFNVLKNSILKDTRLSIEKNMYYLEHQKFREQVTNLYKDKLTEEEIEKEIIRVSDNFWLLNTVNLVKLTNNIFSENIELKIIPKEEFLEILEQQFYVDEKGNNIEKDYKKSFFFQSIKDIDVQLIKMQTKTERRIKELQEKETELKEKIENVFDSKLIKEEN